nr:F-box only protein 27-like isoform X1 [Cherax quadricarinatus]
MFLIHQINTMGNTSGSGTTTEGNGIEICGNTLPQEVMYKIFLYVPVKDLVTSVTRVCPYWHNLLTEHHFWFTKVLREGFRLPAATKQRLLEEADEAQVLRILQGISGGYLPLNTNLICNPSGREKLNHWKVKHGGDGMIVEDHPVGTDPIPAEAGLPTQHCFVTSYGICSRLQVINLESIGFDPHVVDILKPAIHISEWVSARWDCHSRSNIVVSLEGLENIQQVKLHWSSQEENVINSHWYKMETTLVDYPKGLKRITYTNVGKDSAFWAGHYGAKTAGSTVKFVL